VPNCRAYDPAFAGELAVIVDHGARRMLEQQVDEFYYITMMNENYAQPSLPADAAGDVIRGLYRFSTPAEGKPQVRLLGSGAILREVIAAAELLQQDWSVTAEVYSATSFSELARDGAEAERWNRLHPDAPARQSHVGRLLAGDGPVVAAPDYVRAYPLLIAPYLNPGADYTVLGTDGFGRSDTRAALRRFFEVDRHAVVLAALEALASREQLPQSVRAEAIKRYGIAADTAAPWTC
jgi:pyruvate dehydrogenase E1 component